MSEDEKQTWINERFFYMKIGWLVGATTGVMVSCLVQFLVKL